MAVAAPKRRTAPAPPPARTTPPKRKAPQRKAAVAAPAPARVPARKPARKAPQRAKPRPRRNPGARVIPFAGRTAVAVTQLPNSNLIVRLTRGRLWIGVLGTLLVGIVALNVVNLSFTANAAKIDASIAALESENGVLEARQATRFSVDRLQSAGREMGYVQPSMEDAHFVEYNRDTLATAAGRLAAASP
jgi:hypothetical protein